MPEGYLAELVAKAKEAVNIPILAGGRMNDAYIAEAAIQNELGGLPVEIYTGQAVTAGQLRDMDADVIILATGSVPVMPEVPGMDGEKVLGCMEAFACPEKAGHKVVVTGGGLAGCEMALEYAQAGKEVTVAEALPKILPAGIPSPIPDGQMLPGLSGYHYVNMLENHRLFAVEDDKVILESDRQKKTLDADSVVIAAGVRPAFFMVQELSGYGAVVYEIGDGQKVRTILHAIWDGYEAGNNI